MPDLSIARTLPAPSRAERDVASQREGGHAKATGHFLAYAVLGRGAGIRMQAESMLELKHLYLLNADPDVVDLREQVRFRYGAARERQHVFDIFATMRDGARIAYAVKPERRLVSGRFLAEMEVVAWWVHATRFADDVRILTEHDVDPVALHNARIFAAVREPDAEADAAAAAVAGAMLGCVALRDLTERVGLGARGQRALLRLVRDGRLAPPRPERIVPTTPLAPTGGR